MEDIAALHRAEYGTAPRVIAKAPGGVNVVGSYTEPNAGYVLAAGINRWVAVALTPRRDNALRFFATHLGERKRANLTTLKFRREDRWANLPKGILWELSRRGLVLGGVNATLCSTIPDVGGLGLHAATMAACCETFSQLFSLELTTDEILSVARNVELRFLGRSESTAALVTALHARNGRLLYIDTRSLNHSYVENTMTSALFMVTDSGVPVTVSDSDREQRLTDCRRGAQLFGARNSPACLRELSAMEVQEAEGNIPEHVRRRCLHVIEENRRVLLAVEALRKGDPVLMGRILLRSHDSQRDLYEISCPEIDWLVKRSAEIKGIFGATLTGPGFGGCTVSLLEEGARAPYYARLEEYERIFGFHPVVLEVGSDEGVHLDVGV